MATQSDSPSISMLPVGSNILITGGSFMQNNAATKDLNLLYDKVAPNAILNAGGRADPVGCYRGTRKEVIARIEKWIGADHLQDHGIFWLSGPAGAGKSAIVQTIAERCLERKVPMANFFFFRADNTRNHSGPVVATILFQIIQLYPELKAHVTNIVANNPVIIRQSIRAQFSTLIEKPLRSIRQSPGKGPFVMLIDGLDECGSESGKAEQTSLLRILHEAVMQVDPAFIVLVASRTESHLTIAFNEIGNSPDSIYLDESYSPSDDIRVFLTNEFSKIKRTHGQNYTLDAEWPSSADFETIVEKSSGQFVYATTVTRFISNSAASPKRSLEIVLGLRPVMKTSPFATLDSLYMLILSQAEDWKSVRDILAAEKVISSQSWASSSASSSASLTSILIPLGYTEDDIHSSLCDLTAIIRFLPQDKHLTIFHASLNDFLYNESRADSFYIDINKFACRLAPPHFKQIASLDDLHCSFQVLESVTEPDELLNKFLKSFLPNPEPFQKDIISLDLGKHCMEILATLYQSRDPRLHKIIATRWQEWFGIPPSTPSQRPSTPPSSCFPILWLRRNRTT